VKFTDSGTAAGRVNALEVASCKQQYRHDLRRLPVRRPDGILAAPFEAESPSSGALSASP